MNATMFQMGPKPYGDGVVYVSRDGGQTWGSVARDRDRDPGGDETRSGSVERSEIEPGPKASPE